jgi:hypothetical protein
MINLCLRCSGQWLYDSKLIVLSAYETVIEKPQSVSQTGRTIRMASENGAPLEMDSSGILFGINTGGYD